jgi:hypothetical protein
MNLDREIELARLRVYRAIELFIARRLAEPNSARRSIGQVYRRRRERMEKGGT